MEYVDIIIEGMGKEHINLLVKNVMGIDHSKVIRSHFYTDEYGDFEYNDEIDLNEYFSENRTCNVFLSSLKMDRTYKNVLIIITSDMNDINITVNIEYEQFRISVKEEFIKYLKRLFHTFSMKGISVINSYDNEPFIIIGS